MNNSDNNRELTYNEAKALLASMNSNTKQSNQLQNNPNNINLEFSEELAENNNLNKEQKHQK